MASLIDKARCKNKKRKTRKFLDEIRKRSLSNFMNTNTSKQTLSNNIETANKFTKQRNCITTDRLTLKMFTKAVCSETMTRPLLIDCKKSNFNNKRIDKSFNKINFEFEDSNASKQYQQLDYMSEKSRECISLNDTEESSAESLMLFSPINRIDHNDSDYDSSTHIKPLSVTLIENAAYKVYKNFMTKVPKNIRNNYQDLTSDDFIVNAIKQLKNIRKVYIGNLHQFQNAKHNKVNTVQSNKDIVENAMEYIRMSSFQEYYSQEEMSGSTTPEIESFLHSPPETSPNMLHSSIVSQTPDYAYYPHKLNE